MQHCSEPLLSSEGSSELVRLRTEIARLRQQVSAQAQELAEQRAACARADAELTEQAHELARQFEQHQRLEEGLRETQRLESLGMLAGGIAHDFNNILTSVLGYADLALLDLPNGSPAAPSIVEIISGVQCAAELTEQMLAYSGKGRFASASVRIAELVREMASFVRISIPKKVEIIYRSDPCLPLVLADATQIRQVIMNLILNAAEAIGDQHGRIVVSIGLVPPDDRRLGEGMLLVADPGRPHIVVEIRDTGDGMTPEVLKRLFDPFFTTKISGRGLGMSVVQGIVRGHAGGIAIESTPGVGTTIMVYLPVLAGAEPAAHPLLQARTEPQRRVVLVVDDEPQVLTIVQRMLERLGYTVLTAGLPEQAIACFHAEHQRIDGVLLDLTMPQMDGSELLRRLRDIDSGVRVVLCSGYSESFATERFESLGLAGFLPKPYRIDELRRVLIDALTPST
jgi:two-component system, cell cycle sensor histidine kinase and response regulator CckA